MRAAALVYPKAAAGGMDRSDEAETRSCLESLLGLAAERACRPGVMRQMEGGAARRLLAAAAHLGCTVPRVLSGAILTEMVRDSGEGEVESRPSGMGGRRAAGVIWSDTDGDGQGLG